tara:strand:- start:1189 stop:1425 length:237 start_codon:yes stop_codon:yes gene_type:complete
MYSIHACVWGFYFKSSIIQKKVGRVARMCLDPQKPKTYYEKAEEFADILVSVGKQSLNMLKLCMNEAQVQHGKVVSMP